MGATGIGGAGWFNHDLRGIRCPSRLRERRDCDLVESNRCEFLVLAAGTGGRWHEDCIRLVTALARYRAASEPAVLRRSMQLAFQRRWWSLLSVALHNSIATALDPTLDIAEDTFPVASAIDVWVRDPPAVSSLPARGA